jgi:hypothetical protein
MPTFQITAPDGKKYRITGETAEGAYAALQSHIGNGATAQAEKPAYELPYGAGQAWTDAATGGMAGKAGAALNAAIRAPFTDKTFGEEYDELYGSLKTARDKYAEESPTANMAASIGGGVIGGGQLMSGAGGLLGRIPGVNTVFNSGIVGRTAADAIGGAAFGGLSAAGYDQDVGTGALIGGGSALLRVQSWRQAALPSTRQRALWGSVIVGEQIMPFPKPYNALECPLLISPMTSQGRRQRANRSTCLPMLWVTQGRGCCPALFALRVTGGRLS